jgi:tRNA (guanosine-2'-O-)-methyltransferase
MNKGTKSSRFPHGGPLQIGSISTTADEIFELVAPYLTPERRARIADVVAQRTYSITTVLENIYDRGNTSAVMRSAEAMGYQSVHVIEPGEKFKKANRVTQGADKWLDIERWKTATECATALKERGYKIYCTHLEAAVPIGEIDWSQPAAIVFGNEKDGVSPELVRLSDQSIIIPMLGFVQSFNISVAAAISLYHIYQDRLRRLGYQGDLTDEEKRILSALFCLRSAKNPERLLARLRERRKQN